jgi:hypothetical protein
MYLELNMHLVKIFVMLTRACGFTHKILDTLSLTHARQASPPTSEAADTRLKSYRVILTRGPGFKDKLLARVRAPVTCVCVCVCGYK